jgi:hypothetical protein
MEFGMMKDVNLINNVQISCWKHSCTYSGKAQMCMKDMLRLLAVCSGAYTLARLRKPTEVLVMIDGLQAKLVSRMLSRNAMYSTVTFSIYQ